MILVVKTLESFSCVVSNKPCRGEAHGACCCEGFGGAEEHSSPGLEELHTPAVLLLGLGLHNALLRPLTRIIRLSLKVIRIILTI